MVILNKKPVVDGTVSVHMFGRDYQISVDEAKRYVNTNQLYFKANKPVSEKDFNKFLAS
jgi:hypothetical protein